ncbi:hypothetical protein P4S64_05290 [Vibrio sp. M60_M31a]
MLLKLQSVGLGPCFAGIHQKDLGATISLSAKVTRVGEIAQGWRWRCWQVKQAAER